MAEFAVLIRSLLILCRIALWLTKLNRKYFRDRWYRISLEGPLALILNGEFLFRNAKNVASDCVYGTAM